MTDRESVLRAVYKMVEQGCACDAMRSCGLHTLIQELDAWRGVEVPRGVEVEEWRRMGWEEEMEFQQWLRRGMEERRQAGMNKYQSHIRGFQGQPLKHAVEEWLDMGRYLYWEMRRQSER